MPGLKTCKSNDQQLFYLQLSLLTTDKNPLKKEFIHTDKLEYHSDDVTTCDNGSVLIPLSSEDIQKGIKE